MILFSGPMKRRLEAFFRRMNQTGVRAQQTSHRKRVPIPDRLKDGWSATHSRLETSKYHKSLKKSSD